MEEVVIVGCVRTPIGSFGGSLREVAVERLGAVVLNEALKRAGLEPALVDDVIAGQSYQGGECANCDGVWAGGWIPSGASCRGGMVRFPCGGCRSSTGSSAPV